MASATISLHQGGTTLATLIRFREPFRELAALQHEMSRFLNSPLDNGNGSTNQGWVPAVDVWEREDDVVYAFDLPGVAEDGISVEYEDNALTVSAERARTEQVGDDRFYRFERRFGTFQRTIGLPQGVREEDIAADYRNGVLEVVVRKPQQPKPRRIQVGGSQQATIEGTATESQS
jgi:HSP20 family protein